MPSFSDRPVHASLGAWRAVSVQGAMERARHASEPFLGPISLAHAQICPQNPGKLTVDDAETLRLTFPATQFRLHANAQVAGWSSQADASTFGEHEGYFHTLSRVSEALGARAYTWHAGRRKHADLNMVLWRTRALADEWGIDVGIEGLYPTPDDRYLLSTWDEYEMLLRSKVKFALDLSHLNILAHRHGRENKSWLVQELLQSDACIEIHFSGNDGDADTHGQLASEPWWWEFLDRANPDAVIFSEGGQVRPTFY